MIKSILALAVMLLAVALSQAQQQTFITWTTSWSHDDAYIAAGNSNGELSIYETTHWKKIKSWSVQPSISTITRVEWNPKFPILAVAAYSHTKGVSIVQLFDISQNKVIKTLPDTLYGRALTWSPNGEQVAFVGNGGRISIFNKDGALRKTLSFTNSGSLFEIDWHPTKNLLLGVEDDIYIIDIDNDKVLAKYDDGSKGKGILCCQWHPSGEFFVTGDYGHENEGGEPSYVKFWRNNGTLIKRIAGSKFELRNTRWTKDGKYLAASGDVLLIMDEKGGLVRKTRFDENNLWGVAWNNKGDKIVTSDQVGNIRVSDLNGKILKTFRQ